MKNRSVIRFESTIQKQWYPNSYNYLKELKET